MKANFNNLPKQRKYFISIKKPKYFTHSGHIFLFCFFWLHINLFHATAPGGVQRDKWHEMGSLHCVLSSEQLDQKVCLSILSNVFFLNVFFPEQVSQLKDLGSLRKQLINFLKLSGLMRDPLQVLLQILSTFHRSDF